MAKGKLTPKQERFVASPIGRPSSYRSEMCQQMIDMGAKGYAVVEIAVGLGIRKSTLYAWVKDQGKPEFSDAFTCARELAEAHHAAIYRKGCGLPSSAFNAAGYAKYMGVVFQDWREVTRTELSGIDGAPIETADVSEREIAQRAAFLLKRGMKAVEARPH